MILDFLFGWYVRLTNNRKLRVDAEVWAAVRARAILKLARMGRPTTDARFLRLTPDGKFVYGVVPTLEKLSNIERESLLLDGEKARIHYREIQVSAEKVLKQASQHSRRTGELLPTRSALLLGE